MTPNLKFLREIANMTSTNKVSTGVRLESKALAQLLDALDIAREALKWFADPGISSQNWKAKETLSKINELVGDGE